MPPPKKTTVKFTLTRQPTSSMSAQELESHVRRNIPYIRSITQCSFINGNPDQTDATVIECTLETKDTDLLRLKFENMVSNLDQVNLNTAIVEATPMSQLPESADTNRRHGCLFCCWRSCRQSDDPEEPGEYRPL